MSSELNATDNLNQRFQIARTDVERRVREGELNVAQQLLTDDAELASDSELAIELIYAEFVALEEVGAEPSPEDIYRRYPKWRDRLERLLKVHDVLSDTADIHLPPSPETQVGIASSHDTLVSEVFTTGRMIGQYELLEEIGRGGMGLVYKARQQGLNRIVAVKLIRSAKSAANAERARFRIEAEAAASLKHANIVHIYEVGVHDGCDFLSMEFLDGLSLEDRLRDKQLSVRDAAELIATLAESIHVAHEHGIIHRDLKPGNVLFSGDTPKISDFGLAKLASSAPIDQTQSGTLLGTPCYMSPEQAACRSSEITAATDTYSLGAMLYEILVGKPPFLAATAIETLDLIRNREAERLVSQDASIPRDLDTICLKCLAKEPRLRYASSLELSNDLRRFLAHEPIHARPVSAAERSVRWIRRHPVVAGLFASLLVVSIVSAFAIVYQRQHMGELSRSAEDTKREADEAEQRADKTGREAAETIDWMSKLGESLYQQPGMSEKALSISQRAVKEYESLLPKYADSLDIQRLAAEAYVRIGWIQLGKGHHELAEQALKQAVEILEGVKASTGEEPALAFAQVGLAHTLRHLGKWPESHKAYQASIDTFEDLSETHPGEGYQMHLANALLNSTIKLRREGRLEVALEAYVRTIRLIRGQIEQSLKTARHFHTAHEPNHLDQDSVDNSSIGTAVREVNLAATIFERIKLEKPSVRSRLERRRLISEFALVLDEFGTAFEEAGRPDQALVALSLALELRQYSLELFPSEYWRKCFVARSHQRIGDFHKGRSEYSVAAESYLIAVSVMREVSEAFPNHAAHQLELSRHYIDLGRIQRKLGQTDEAISTLRKSKDLIQPIADQGFASSRAALARSYYYLARAYGDCCRYSDATSCYQKSLELNPTSSAANNFAWLRLMASDSSVRDPKQALELARLAVKYGPRKAYCWNTLGVALYRNGETAEAGSALRRAIQLDGGGTVHDWFFLAMSHQKQGQSSVAAEWRERATAWCRAQKGVTEELERIQRECLEVFAKHTETDVDE